MVVRFPRAQVPQGEVMNPGGGNTQSPLSPPQGTSQTRSSAPLAKCRKQVVVTWTFLTTYMTSHRNSSVSEDGRPGVLA